MSSEPHRLPLFLAYLQPCQAASPQLFSQVSIKVAAGRCVPRLLLNLPTWRPTLQAGLLSDVMITLLGTDQDTVTVLTAMGAVADLAVVEELRDDVATTVWRGPVGGRAF